LKTPFCRPLACLWIGALRSLKTSHASLWFRAGVFAQVRRFGSWSFASRSQWSLKVAPFLLLLVRSTFQDWQFFWNT
jgi:hypothetical protein